ncbi:unnamed protein product [Prunus armeniaca]
MISTISGGPTLAGSSNRSIKHYVRAAHYPQVFGIEANRHNKVSKVGWEPITFCEEEEEGVIYPHDDPMIIRAEIVDYNVRWVLIDNGSSVNVIFADAFKEMGVADSQPVGSVSLAIAFGVAPWKTMIYDQFLIVDCPTAYNVIIGRTALTGIKAHPSPHMLLMKFSTYNGTGVIRGDQLSARTCYATALKSVACKPPMEAMSVEGLPNGSGPHRISTTLNPHLWTQFIAFCDTMPRSSPSLKTICPTYPQTSSATSSASPLPISLSDRSDALMMSNGTRPCVPKLTSLKPSALSWKPRTLSSLRTQSWIDQLVDATTGHELLSFMDAYLGYNHIFMHPTDSEHTAFITDRGLYCYNVMPFGLKNAGATYQRLVNRIFAKHIGNIMEVYVDDMLVKSRTAGEHLENLALMFGILRDY